MYNNVTDKNVRMTADFMAIDANSSDAQGVYSTFGKRALDVFLILLASPVVLPLVALMAFMARRDGGPAFFGHERVGRGGQVFKCWKIRTMVEGADEKLAAHLAADPAAAAEWARDQKLRNDPRITRFGALLRRTSLDELPQLWNIFVGEMSIVGPRPFTPEQKDLYVGAAYYALRPGLTGFWQVGDRNDSSFAARAIHDARYAREVGFGTDVATIAKTVGVVLRQTGC